jgi:(R,R)-butanediol dehydrogenase / meso-butanediol dehydrogenase / diacetyl reductase
MRSGPRRAGSGRTWPSSAPASRQCSTPPCTPSSAPARVVNVAIWGAPTQIHLNDLVFSEAYLTGIIGYLGDHPATIGLLADDLIDVGFFITKRIKLDELVDGGFHELIQNKDEHVKALVQP